MEKISLPPIEKPEKEQFSFQQNLNDFILGKSAQKTEEKDDQAIYAEAKDEFLELEKDFDCLNEIEKSDLIDFIKNNYINLSHTNPEQLNSYRTICRFNLIKKLLLQDNKVEYFKFLNKLSGLAERKNLSLTYYEAYISPMIYELKNCEKDFLEAFQKNKPDDVRMIILTILDAAQFARIPEKDWQEFMEKAITFLKAAKEQTTNYFIKIFSEDAIGSLEKGLEYGISNKKFWSVVDFKKRYETGERYDSTMTAGKEEREKNKKYDGLLNNYQDADLALDNILAERLKNDIGLDFEILSAEEKIKARLYLPEFLKRVGLQELEKYKKYFSSGSEKDRPQKIMAFFTMEIDKTCGENIILIADKLPTEQSRLIFSKIEELVALADIKIADLQKFFYLDNNPSGIKDARYELLKKSLSIINIFSNNLKNQNYSIEEIRNLLVDLDKTKIEIELLHSVLKSAKENRENINFEIIRDLKIETKEIGEDLSEEEKAQIKKIAIENYSEIYKNAPEELKSVLEELDAELNLEKITGQRKYILKYKEQLIAFCRFKPIEGSSTDVYGGSFHVYRDLQNLCIGKYFVEKAIDKESEKYNIRAICRTELFEQLYQKMGFEKQDEIEENGVKYYNIILPKKETSQEK